MGMWGATLTPYQLMFSLWTVVTSSKYRNHFHKISPLAGQMWYIAICPQPGVTFPICQSDTEDRGAGSITRAAVKVSDQCGILPAAALGWTVQPTGFVCQRVHTAKKMRRGSVGGARGSAHASLAGTGKRGGKKDTKGRHMTGSLCMPLGIGCRSPFSSRHNEEHVRS